jgi:DNA-binding beta-propeller fold protein YncE
MNPRQSVSHRWIIRLSLVLLVALLVSSKPATLAGENGAEGRPGSVWVVNRDTGQLAIFDAKTGELVPTLVEVGAGAHDICVSERAGKAYITAEAVNAVTTVDLKTLAREVIAVAPLPHHCEPSHDGRTVYVTFDSHPPNPVPPGIARYAAINTDDNSVTYTTTSANPFARAHAPHPSFDGETIYVAHDTGNVLTALDPHTNTIKFSVGPILRAEEPLPTRFGNYVWVSARGEGKVKRIDLDTIVPGPAVVESVEVGVQPESLMLSPDERTLAVSLRGSPASLAFVDTVTLASERIQIAGAGTFGDLAVMTHDGRFVYATFDAGSTGIGGVAVVDVHARTVVDTWMLPTPGRPHGIWYSIRKAPRLRDDRSRRR